MPVLLAVFWVLSALAAAIALGSLRLGRHYLERVRSGMQAPGDWTPPATLIVPIKGLEEGLRENLRSLLEQDYPDYELLVTVRNADDPALEVVRPLLSERARLVVAGAGQPATGEKINNLLAAVAAARAASEVFAFADSDGRVERGWLRGLVAPLRDPAAGAATGYRWYFPERAGAWPLARSVWNSTIAGNFGSEVPQFAWGGAMAVRRETFERARVADFWRGAVSDDYRLTQAVRAAGLALRYAPQAMVATTGGCTAREFLSWAVRQIIITRVYHPRLWWTGFLAHFLYCGAMAACAAAIVAGYLWAIPMLALVVGPGLWSGELRRRAAYLMFPSRAAWLDRYGWACVWLLAPATWLWLGIFLASARTRRIHWRGNTYELVSASQTRRVETGSPS